MCFFRCLWFFPSQNLKLVYIFYSLSLKPMQCNGLVYFTVLVSTKRVKFITTPTLGANLQRRNLQKSKEAEGERKQFREILETSTNIVKVQTLNCYEFAYISQEVSGVWPTVKEPHKNMALKMECGTEDHMFFVISMEYNSLIIPISVCYYLELRNAIISYSRVQCLLMKVQ